MEHVICNAFSLRDLKVLQYALKTDRPFVGLIEHLTDKYTQSDSPEVNAILIKFARLNTLLHQRGPT